uniref:Uncharacterized protein n=1 Tax=Globisporangium ultimum (strain ATCC 200006 / CBS 805.95 / DAOM BR144) TaxID=431595 RepID=K3XDE6_GLOUD
MVSPKNPASAAAAIPANATRRPVRSQLRLPAHPFQPTLLTNQKRELVEREGMFKCKFKFNTRHFGIWVRTHPKFKRKFKFNARHFGIWVRTHPKFKRNFKSIEVGIWFRTHPKC